MDPASPKEVRTRDYFLKYYEQFSFILAPLRILRTHGNFWNPNNFQTFDKQFGDIRAHITADIMVVASCIKTAFVTDFCFRTGNVIDPKGVVPFFTLQLAINAVTLTASTSMTCLAFIRLSLKSLLIPKSKSEESWTKEPEGNSAEMCGQDPNKPPQWELSYEIVLCRKKKDSKTEFDDVVVTSAFLKDVLELLVLHCRDQERVLMKKWFGDESSTARNEDSQELRGATGVDGETSFEAEDEEKDVIKKWIHRALKIFNFSDFPPPGTHPYDKGNFPRYVFVLKPKASTQPVPEQNTRPQTASTRAPGSTDQSAAGTSDSRSEQGSQKESVDFKRREIGGSSGRAAGNAKAKKERVQPRIARKIESDELEYYILERRDLNDVIEETNESVAPPEISLMVQLLNYSYDLGRKIANLKISGVLPLPDSKKEDVKAIFAGLQKCLEALKLATIMTKRCGLYDPILPHFFDCLAEISEKPEEFSNRPVSSEASSSSGDPAKLHSRGQTTKSPHSSEPHTTSSLEKANCIVQQLLEECAPTEALSSSDEATKLFPSLKFSSF